VNESGWGRHGVLDGHAGKAVLVEVLSALIRRAREGEPDSVLDERAQLLERLARDSPAVDVEGLGPPSIGLLVVEDSNGHGRVRVA
jgi:hypothetical protein